MRVKDKMIDKNKNIRVGDVVKVSSETVAVYYLIALDVSNEYCLVNLTGNRVTHLDGGLKSVIQYFDEYKVAKCEWYKLDAEVIVSD